MKKARKWRIGLALRLVLAALIMSLIPAAASTALGTYLAAGRAAGEWADLGDTLAHTLAGELTAGELTAGSPDTDALRQRLTELRDGCGAEEVYICAPEEDEARIIVTTAVGGAARRPFDDGAFPKGDILDGEEIGPVVWDGHKRVTACAPIAREEDEDVYYAVVEFNLSRSSAKALSGALAGAALAAGIAVLLSGVYYVVVKKNVIQPVKRLTDAAIDYSEGGNRLAFSKLKFAGSMELTALADSFRMMLAEIEVNNLEQQEKAVQEQKTAGDMALAGGLNSAARPRELPGGRDYPFRLAGMVNGAGRALNGCFYDYFVTDGDKLCFALGEASGEGMSQAIFAVIGETTLKSHLRSGLSLEEAMTAANRQLHEMGGGVMYLNVAAGVLDGAVGRMKLVNAGASLPLLMRFADSRYDWSDALPQVPLGQNENVAYTCVELELSQGDRVFLHTAGIEDISSGGKTFREELRRCLNELKTRTADPDEQLRLVSDAGAAFTEDNGSGEPYAIMSVEYCRRDRMSAHCLVTGDDRGAAELTAFLRGQLRSNGVDERRAAETIVAADELFALCRAKYSGRFMAECAIKDGLAVIRLRGSMGGTDPLSGFGALSGGADFIRRSCERVLFEPGRDADTVTVVRRVG